MHDAPQPRRSRRAGPPRPTPLRFVAALLLLVAAGAFLLTGPEARADLLAEVPEGAGARFARMLLALGTLAALAWGVLPVAYHPTRWLRIAGDRIRGRTGTARALLGPVLLLAESLRALFLLLFVLVAALVLGMFFVALLYAVWVVVPDLLGGHEALVSRLADLRGLL